MSFENFKFIFFQEYLGDTRKVTRKEHLLDTRLEPLFLPEGYSSCILGMEVTGTGDRNREQKSVGVAFSGRAWHKEPSTWVDGS